MSLDASSGDWYDAKGQRVASHPGVTHQKLFSSILSELTSGRHLLVATSDTEFSTLIHNFVLPIELYRSLSNQTSPRSLCVIFGRRISGWYGNILLLLNFVAAPWQSSNVSYSDEVTFSSCQVFSEDWPHTSRWNRQRGHSGVSRACPLYSAITHSLQAARQAIEALGSDIPKTEFIDLVAGWETFTRTGVALPQETVECVKHETVVTVSCWLLTHSVLRSECDCALFGSVRYAWVRYYFHSFIVHMLQFPFTQGRWIFFSHRRSPKRARSVCERPPSYFCMSDLHVDSVILALITSRSLLILVQSHQST